MVLVEAVTLLEEKQPHCVGALVPAICIGYRTYDTVIFMIQYIVLTGNVCQLSQLLVLLFVNQFSYFVFEHFPHGISRQLFEENYIFWMFETSQIILKTVKKGIFF